MANYTITVQSGESSTKYDRHAGWSDVSSEFDEKISGSFSFQLPNLSGTTIKSISITAPVNATSNGGGQGDFSLKLGSQTLNTWTDSDTTVWGASGLSIAGKQSDSITLNLNPSSKLHKNEYTGVIKGWWSWTGRELGRATATIVVSGEFKETIVAPLSGEVIPKSLPNTFSWTRTIVTGSIKSQTLYWKKKSASSYTSINVGASATKYTFPANTFENGTINWYIKATDSAGNTATSAVSTVTVGIVPSVMIAYPNKVNIRNGNEQIFTWEMQEKIETGQKAYEIQYKSENAENWTVISRNSSEQYHTFEPETFETATYYWKLKVTNNDGLSTDYVEGEFYSIGGTDAPNVVSVTNSSIPTIIWDIDSQDTFELEIFIGEERIYVSGVQVGADLISFTPNIMLEDGNYIVKMRAMNEYGYFTGWADYSFVIETEKPAEVECMVYANEYHGVNITKFNELRIPSRLYVLRRVFGADKWDILGKLNDVFIDNTVISNIKYEYAIRNYIENAGYSDSKATSIVIDYQGSYIYDGNEFVKLYLTEDEEFSVSHTPSKTFAYSYTIGRKYPVRESSEWMAHNTDLSCFVSFEEYEKLEKFYESNDDLWFKNDDFSFKCAIDSITIRKTLLGRGYSINISLSRTDENEVNLIE